MRCGTARPPPRPVVKEIRVVTLDAFSQNPEPDRPDADPAAPPTRSRWRRILAGTVTVAAAVLVFFALATPNNISRLPEGSSTSQALIRIPIEALLGVAILLALPGRARKVVAVIGGVLLGVLSIIKIIDIGFYTALARPFNPVLDWVLLDDGISFLEDSDRGDRDAARRWSARCCCWCSYR